MRLLTTDFKVHQANDLVDYLDNQTMFFFAGQTLPYSNNSTQEFENSVQETFYTPHNEMVFGKLVSTEDYIISIRRVDWTANTVYTRYDNITALKDEDFYVVSQEGLNYSVFKCLDNNNGSPSTHKPILSETSPLDEFYQTSDGYVWKLMYTYTEAQHEKFATPDFVPFVANNEVSGNTVSGSIDVIDVVSGGLGYSNYGEGNIVQINVSGNSRKFYIQSSNDRVLSANSGFYSDSAFYIDSGPGAGQIKTIVDYGQEGNNKYVIVDSDFSTAVTTASTFKISSLITLQGDGSNFVGRAVMNTINDSIDKIEIVNRGQNYDYGNVIIGANTQALNSDSFTEAELRAIIPPYGGHGFDQQIELFGYYVCISENFVGTNVPSANNDYRTIGLFENPIFNETILTLDSVSGLTNNTVVTQAATSATGTISEINLTTDTITLEQVTGIFDNTDIVAANTTYSVTNVVKDNSIFDQRLALDVSVTFGSQFDQDELIIQETTGAQGYVHEYSNNTLYLVQTRGFFDVSIVNEIIGQNSGTKAIINNITQPGTVRYTGNIYYVENIDPVTRFDDQTESIKLIIGF